MISASTLYSTENYLFCNQTWLVGFGIWSSKSSDYYFDRQNHLILWVRYLKFILPLIDVFDCSGNDNNMKM